MFEEWMMTTNLLICLAANISLLLSFTKKEETCKCQNCVEKPELKRMETMYTLSQPNPAEFGLGLQGLECWPEGPPRKLLGAGGLLVPAPLLTPCGSKV